MPEYQLQIKQVVDYPRCRIYREFIHKLINDRSIRINGGSGLFHFTVLCSYANFRTSYRRIDGISYDRIFVTSVSEPTTANAGKLLKPSVPSFGAIPPRTV